MMTTRHNLYDLDRDGLRALLAEWGYSDYHASRLWQALYRQGARSFDEMEELRPDLIERLRQTSDLVHLRPVHEALSQDGTRKLLLGLPDGETVETVLMRYRDRYTACVSTQVGCAMGCVFCATGQMGFTRHLTPGEIVGQVLYVNELLAPQGASLRNIVLMGMGEPLHNYDNTMTAIDILTDDNGLAMAARHITLSTVGLVPAIRRLADEERPIHLAVSLHGATNAERKALVPIGRRWDLAALMDACRYYSEKRKRRIFFEWTLIEGENDTPEQAHALGELLQGMDAHVNLIPLNPTSGYDGQPTRSPAARRFQQILADYDIPSTVRQRRGIDIAAGCGQLRTDMIELAGD